jgi:hypothetical protein
MRFKVNNIAAPVQVPTPSNVINFKTTAAPVFKSPLHQVKFSQVLLHVVIFSIKDTFTNDLPFEHTNSTREPHASVPDIVWGSP